MLRGGRPSDQTPPFWACALSYRSNEPTSLYVFTIYLLSKNISRLARPSRALLHRTVVACPTLHRNRGHLPVRRAALVCHATTAIPRHAAPLHAHPSQPRRAPRLHHPGATRRRSSPAGISSSAIGRRHHDKKKRVLQAHF
jgi:hypothetical protein